MESKRYGKLFIGFFIIMIVLTVLSRAADSVTVAKVTAAQPMQGTLAFNNTVEGKIKASDQSYIRGEEGTFLEKIHVGEGQRVEKGDTLFSLDLETAKERLADAEAELATLRLNLKKAELDSSGSAAERAALENAKRELERAKADSDLNTELNGGMQMLKDKRAIEDAEAGVRTAQKALEEGRQRSGIDLELSRQQIRDKETALKRLREICGSGGVIKAEAAGTIGELTAKAGTKLSGETLCSLVPDDAEYTFEGTLDEKEAKYMNVGDKVSITLAGKMVPIEGAEISSLQVDGSNVKVIARLPKETKVTNGMNGSLKHTSISQSYGVTIPLSALRGSENEYYVLVARETNTVLGNELKAEKVEVQLLEKDSKKAAIEGNLDGKVITESSKPISAGDRVREMKTDE